MTAFGPFANVQVIDFTLLGKNTLFLINGPTGAGKTTILDAICFALYGQTTGAEREGRQMRCDYAAPGLLTEVELTFELNAVRYRVHREPEQFKPRSRNSEQSAMDVLHKPTANLYRLQGEQMQLLAGKVSEVTRAIEGLTSLKVDQFRQVMVLPQGKFRQLLMADSKHREEIFSQLFQTHHYKRIEDKLRALSKTVVDEANKLRDKQLGVLQSVGLDTVEDLNATLVEQRPLAQAEQKRLKTKQAQVLELNAHFQALQQLDQQFERLAQLYQQRTELKEEAQQVTLLTVERQQAQLAAKLMPLYAELSRCERDKTTLLAEQGAAETALLARQSALDTVMEQVQQLPECEQQVLNLQQEITQLQAYQSRADTLEVAIKAHTDSAQQLAQNQQLTEEKSKQVAALTQSCLNLEQQHTQTSQTLANEAELKTGLLEINRQLELFEQREKASAQLAIVNKELKRLNQTGDQLKTEFEKAQKHHQQLELRWHQGQASILARQLEPDNPCPVCGSTEHPAPSSAGDNSPPSDEQRAEAVSLLDDIRSKLNDAREKYGELNAQSKELTAQTEKPISPANQHEDIATLKQRLADKQAQLDNWNLQQVKLGEIAKQLAEMQEQKQQDATALTQHQTALAQSEKQTESQRTALELARNELPKQYRETGALLQAIVGATSTLQVKQQFIETTRSKHLELGKAHEGATALLASLDKAILNAQRSHAAATTEWQASLLASEFNNQQEYEAASRSEAQLAELTTAIDSFTQKQNKLLGAIEQQEAVLKGQEKPNIAEQQHVLEEQQQALQQAESRWQQLHSRLSQLENADKLIQTLTKEQHHQEQQYKTIGTLSEVANGQTGKKISLQRFVLGVLLDDVLIAASQRLTQMSKGRYALIRKEDPAKGGKASGLELEVDDAYTGKTRSVATLSGGESFIASLSLALGLSEVVQAYAGGVHLDTLFVDEGFGSLDADSLDEAVRTLMDLGESGRMVGVISHVAELREQIHQRIDIVSGKQGSSVNIHV